MMFKNIFKFAESTEILQEARKNVSEKSIFREICIFIGIFFSIMIIRVVAGKVLVSSLNLPDEYSLLLTLFSYVIGAILYCLVVIKLEKRNLRSIGFSKDNIPLSILKGLIIGFLMFLAVVGIGLLLGQYSFKGFDSSTLILGIPFLLGFFVQSFTEEIQYRGWAMTYISKRHSVFIGFLISDLLFVFMHMSSNGISIIAMINIFIVGLLFTALFWKYDNIWVCGSAHAMWNFTQGYLFGFNVSGKEMACLFSFGQNSQSIIGGGTFGPESSLIATFVIIITLIIVLYWDKINKTSIES